MDDYYSNGLIFKYRFVPESKKGDSLRNKEIIDFHLGHKFFTPDGLLDSEIKYLDRPYAGLLYIGASKAKFNSASSRFLYGANLGVTGRPSAADAIQIWYHNAVGFDRPQGWHNQIRATLVLNAFAEFNKQIEVLPGSMDLISSTQATLGTGHVNMVQRLDVRMGKLKNLNASPLLHAVIGNGSDRFEKAGYMIFGYGLQYVMYDVTIQGSMFNDDSPHTERIVPWVQHFRIGWATSSRGATFKMTYNHLGKEVKMANKHSYISMELTFRFKNK